MHLGKEPHSLSSRPASWFWARSHACGSTSKHHAPSGPAATPKHRRRRFGAPLSSHPSGSRGCEASAPKLHPGPRTMPGQGRNFPLAMDHSIEARP